MSEFRRTRPRLPAADDALRAAEVADGGRKEGEKVETKNKGKGWAVYAALVWPPGGEGSHNKGAGVAGGVGGSSPPTSQQAAPQGLVHWMSVMAEHMNNPHHDAVHYMWNGVEVSVPRRTVLTLFCREGLDALGDEKREEAEAARQGGRCNRWGRPRVLASLPKVTLSRTLEVSCLDSNFFPLGDGRRRNAASTDVDLLSSRRSKIIVSRRDADRLTYGTTLSGRSGGLRRQRHMRMQLCGGAPGALEKETTLRPIRLSLASEERRPTRGKRGSGEAWYRSEWTAGGEEEKNEEHGRKEGGDGRGVDCDASGNELAP
ncbi:hypothetical protein O3P69_013588 [Scylla paramamosain]|uniref:Uncharacterized protein n=1 Tax=Scylla paramamosain TaxID=85552 RepID=A0AAW0SQR4_SCYPA